MALIFCDSFDHYDDAQFTSKWTAASGTGSDDISAVGRNGTNGAGPHQDNNGFLMKQFGAHYSRLITGMAVQRTTSGFAILFGLYADGSQHVDVRISSSVLIVTRGGTTIATGTTVLSQDVYYYIELDALIDNTSGAIELRLNGLTEATFSGDTYVSGAVGANQLRLGGSGSSFASSNYDDLYVCDASGGAPTNTFLGDVRVEAIFPNGNGNSSQFDGSDGNSIDNYLLVDDTTVPDEDTTYVESDTPSDKDTYAYGNLVTTSGTVYGVQLLPRLRKTDAGSRTMVTVARTGGGTEEDGPPKAVLDSYSYSPYSDIRETKPGGGAWTIADVNAAEFGIKVNT